MSHCRIFHYVVKEPTDVNEIKTNADYLYDQLGGVADYVTDKTNLEEDLKSYLDDIPFEIKQDEYNATYALISAGNVNKLSVKIREDWNKRMSQNSRSFDRFKSYLRTGIFSKEIDISYYHSRNALEDKYGYYFYHHEDYARIEERFLIEFLAQFAEKIMPLFIIASFDYHY